ncbi:glutathione S-transferase family protein [Piscinibacter sp. HJYY11]|uniref:glutathione S-transferase family protein n=1 Tax=Piscinibacter sp. HJYY11 TaxID=2801333 RepID=UPI00191EB1C6|nr:glutathione S-transferase family protein [Piscinibacter sp. HJYY11]MBL0729793.1 glutathione S-transferase family protein [Piscinibacter sp. HJYY11]
MALHLYIGNKNYSSWSMRPWVLMKEAGIPFDETVMRLDYTVPDSHFKKEIVKLNPAGRVPVLVDGDLVIWDSLAIAEYLAEKFPEKALWPTDAKTRARARSVVAEMHSGFSALRTHFGMNIEAQLQHVGPRVLAEQPQVRADLDRIVQMWGELLATYQGPLLFGSFSIADAFYAPVVKRIVTYGLPVPPAITAYIERVQSLKSVAAWTKDALAEHDFLAGNEDYRTSR